MLVAGVSGVVGHAAAGHFASLPDWEVVGVSRRRPAGLGGVDLVSVDLTDEAECRRVFSRMRDVTHVVFAALSEQPGLVAGWHDRAQMEKNERMLRNLLEPLGAASSRLRHVSLLQGTKAYGVHVAPIDAPARERAPRHEHENFYWLQEDYLRDAAARAGWAFTILRPQIVFGLSIGSAMNLIPALGVYGAVLKEQGEPLHYPGGPSVLGEAVDADLLAHALAWAASHEAARGEIFNVTNGDVFAWPTVWPVIADALGMEPGRKEATRLAERMPELAGTWDRVRERHALVSPGLGEFVGESFHYADFCMATGADPSIGQRPPLVSTVKLRQAGFLEFVDTEEMFRKWFRLFQRERLLPPR